MPTHPVADGTWGTRGTPYTHQLQTRIYIVHTSSYSSLSVALRLYCHLHGPIGGHMAPAKHLQIHEPMKHLWRRYSHNSSFFSVQNVSGPPGFNYLFEQQQKKKGHCKNK